MQLRESLNSSPIVAGWSVALFSFVAGLSPSVAQVLTEPDPGHRIISGAPACQGGPGGATARSWLFGADLGANDGSSTVFRINVETGEVCIVGETGLENIFDVAFLPDGRLFGLRTRFFGSDLVSINPRTGQSVLVGSGTGFDAINGLIATSTNRLLASTSEGELLEIDPDTGLGSRIGSLGSGLRSAGDLALAPDGRLFLAACDGYFFCDPVLVEVDVATGRGTPKALGIGFDDVFGLAFEPSSELTPETPGQPTQVATPPRLLAVAHGDRFDQPLLIEIDTDTGRGTQLFPLATYDGMGGLAANVRILPVWGPFVITDDDNPSCRGVHASWTACQHMTGFHGPGSLADDTYAWDMNLRYPAHPDPDDADDGKPVFPVAPGRVVRKAGSVPPGGSAGIVHIEHSPTGAACSSHPDACWWSGYLHLEEIAVDEGETVDYNTVLGFVGRAGADNNHLHFVVYEGRNTAGALESVDAAFECIPVPPKTVSATPVVGSRSFFARQTLRVGPSFQIQAGARARMYSGESVILGNGFSVELEGELVVETDRVRGCP